MFLNIEVSFEDFFKEFNSEVWEGLILLYPALS